MRIGVALVVALALQLVAPGQPAQAATTAQLRSQVITLKHQNASLTRQLAKARRSRDWWRSKADDRARLLADARNRLAFVDAGRKAAEQAAADARQAASAADARAASADANAAAAAAQAETLRQGLPAAIAAVPVNRFVELVLTPARALWRCDSVYTSSGYWSIEFTSDC